jgi:hypothetical protein
MLQTLAYPISQVRPAVTAAGLDVSLATFQSLDSTQGPTGNPVGTYTNVAGLVNIPCMDAPLAPGTISALEAKALAEIESKGIRHVSLAGYYPAVVAGWPQGWRAVIDGLVYDVIGAEADSQNSQTRVKLQQVTVAS